MILFAIMPIFSQPVLSVIVSAEPAFGPENAAAVSSIVTAHVSEIGTYRIVSAAEREAAFKELEFSMSDMADKESQLRVGKLLAAKEILSARCSKAGDYLVLQLSLLDVQTGTVKKSVLGKYRNLGTLLESTRSLVADCFGLDGSREKEGIRFITVTNSTELLHALKSNTVVTLKAGTYDLSEKNDVKHANLSWYDMFDGFYPIIKSVNNLTLRSEGDAEIVIKPSYGWVIDFQTCQNLRFERIRFSHIKPGFCIGGVLRFQLCENVEITGCTLDGSGTYGVELTQTSNFTMSQSRIQNCTYGIAQLYNSQNILFIDSVLTQNQEYTMIDIQNTSNVDFIDCEITRNTGSSLVFVDSSSYSVVFTRTRIANNSVNELFNDRKKIRLEQCIFE